MPEVGAQRKTLDPFRVVNRSISPFIGHLGLQIRVSTDNERNASSWRSRSLGIVKRAGKREEDFGPYGSKMDQCRRMERFGVTGAQREWADPLGVKRLPALRKFRLLRVILRMLRRQNGNRRCILAVPLFAFGNIELKAIRAGKVPCRACHGKSHFLVRCPNVAVNPESFEIIGADRVKRCVLRARIVFQPLSTVFEPEREGDRPSGKIEQIAVHSEIAQRQLKGSGPVQGYINSANSGRAVATEKSQERIKCRRRVGIQQRCTQPGLANNAPGEVFLVVSRITKT